MQFLNPALLAGTALLLVPLVIHLLNRQRHKKRPWAAMEFLLRAYKKQRRRLRRENLLLLLLRCLIPIVLALAVARPVWRGSAAASGGGSVHHIAVLDATFSMGLQQGGNPSPFERGRLLLGRLLDRLEADAEAHPKVTLVLAGVRPRFLVRGDLNLQAARSQWLRLVAPDDGASDLTEAMTQVANLVDEAADPEVRVYVITDLQARAFGKALTAPVPTAPTPAVKPTKPTDPDAPQFQDTLRDVFERLATKKNVATHVIDCGPFADSESGGTADNVQVTGLRIEQPAATARVPITLVATLRNRGKAAATAQATLEIDGSEPMRKVVQVPAGAEGEAEFQVSFRETGRRRLRMVLQNDALEADDEWFATLDVRERIRVLLVDGSQEEDALKNQSYLWQSGLDPTRGQGPPEITVFTVDTTDTLGLLSGQKQPSQYDVTVLADVDRLNERAADELKKAVQAGKGLLVAFGPHTDVASYELQLHGGSEPLMPFRLQSIAGSPAGSGTARTTRLLLPNHPLFAEFEEDVYREVLQAVPVAQWFTIADGSLAANAVVPARLSDAGQSPLFVATDCGEGHALYWLSAPGSEYQPDRWNRFDDPMIAFHLLHGAIKWLSLPASDPFSAHVGQALTCSLPARPENIAVQLPERDGGRREPAADEPRPLASGRYALPPWTSTSRAGFYTFDLQLDRESGKEHLQLPFAVNVEPDEGDLRYAAHSEVTQALGIPRVLTGLPVEVTPGNAAESSEIGPSLLLATLLAVLAEAALARFVSVRRS